MRRAAPAHQLLTPIAADAPQGLKLHAALTITVMLDTLVAHGKVT